MTERWTEEISLHERLGTSVRDDLWPAVNARLHETLYRVAQARQPKNWLELIGTTTADFFALLRESQLRAEQEKRPVQILEIGSGRAYGLRYLAKHSREFIEVARYEPQNDQSAFWFVAVDIDRGTLPPPRVRQKESVNFVQADGTYLPFAQETVDLVLLIGSLNYFDNQKQALNNIYRLLRWQGTMLVYPLDIAKLIEGDNGTIRQRVNSFFARIKELDGQSLNISLKHLVSPRLPHHFTTAYTPNDRKELNKLLEEERRQRRSRLIPWLWPRKRDPWLIALSTAALTVKKEVASPGFNLF